MFVLLILTDLASLIVGGLVVAIGAGLVSPWWSVVPIAAVAYVVQLATSVRVPVSAWPSQPRQAPRDDVS